MESNVTRDVTGCLAMLATFAALLIPLALISAALGHAVLLAPFVIVALWLTFRVRAFVHARFDVPPRGKIVDREVTPSEGQSNGTSGSAVSAGDDHPQSWQRYKLCPYCGRRIAGNSAACDSCSAFGTEIDSPTAHNTNQASLTNPAANPQPSPIVRTTAPPREEPPTAREQWMSTSTASLLAILVLVVVVTALAMIAFESGKESPSYGGSVRPAATTTSGFSVGDQVTLSSDSHAWVLGTETHDDYDAALRAFLSQDQASIQQLIREGRIVFIPNGTQSEIASIKANRLVVRFREDAGISTPTAIVLATYAEHLSGPEATAGSNSIPRISQKPADAATTTTRPAPAERGEGRQNVSLSRAEEITRLQMDHVLVVLESIRVDHGVFPTVSTMKELAQLAEPVYITQLPRIDGFGREFSIDSSPEGFLLASRGRDGNLGSSDDFVVSAVSGDGVSPAHEKEGATDNAAQHSKSPQSQTVRGQDVKTDTTIDVSPRGKEPAEVLMRAKGLLVSSDLGLVWSVQAPGQMIEKQAELYCQQIKLAGKSGWRLPTREELSAMISTDEEFARAFRGHAIWTSSDISEWEPNPQDSDENIGISSSDFALPICVTHWP